MPETIDNNHAVGLERLPDSPECDHWPRTRKGSLKRRLSFREKLLLLDPASAFEETNERLMAFINLFAFRSTGAIITRASGGHRDWTSLKGELAPEHVFRHLIADRLLPIFRPQWIGTRSPSTTCYAVLDVDAGRPRESILDCDCNPKHIHALGYSDIETFLQDRARARKRATGQLSFPDRCRLVEAALRQMGIDPEDPRQLLVLPSPSGGRHYYIFFDGPYFLDQVHDLFRSAGLTHVPGQIEFFPSMDRGLRLPFGHIPGRKHDHLAWIIFINDYLAKRFRRFSLEDLYQQLHSDDESTPPSSRSGDAITSPVRHQAEPKWVGRRSSSHVTDCSDEYHSWRTRGNPPTDELVGRYLEIVDRGPTSLQEAEELIRLGILVPGTRHRVMKILAAHLIWFCHQTVEQATEFLVRWAMDPRHESKDFRADLAHGTSKLVAKIGKLCRWYAEHRKTDDSSRRSGNHRTRLYAREELTLLRPLMQSLPEDERVGQGHFFLSILNFAKLYGRPRDDGSGWEVAPDIKTVVRKWEGCRGKGKYLTRMNRAKESGLLVMIREKWQRAGGKGRARTYFLSVPVCPGDDQTIGYADALAFLTAPPSNPSSPSGEDVPDELSPKDRTDDPSGPEIPTSCGDADTRPLRPWGTRGCLGTGPSQCDPEQASTETVSDCSDETVPSLPPTGFPGEPLAVVNPGEPSRSSMTPEPPMTNREIGSTVPDDRVQLDQVDSDLPPRIRSLTRKPADQLTRKELLLMLNYKNRRRTGLGCSTVASTGVGDRESRGDPSDPVGLEHDHQQICGTKYDPSKPPEGFS